MNNRYLHNLPSPLPASPPSLRSPRRERGFNFLLPSGMGISTIHQPNDSVGTVQSHRNTQLSFPPPIAVEGRLQRESSIDAGYLDSRLRGNDDLFEMCRYPCPPGGEAGGVVNVRWTFTPPNGRIRFSMRPGRKLGMRESITPFHFVRCS